MVRHLLLAIALFLFANHISAQGYQPVLGDTAGYTAGGFSVTDGGASTYGFPIVITPGTAGLQPSISFSYNSQGGNGLMGLGWSIEGLSAISRASQTKAQDGQIKGIAFGSSDRFALDGERLILTDTNNTYGANGVEYRTEQNAIYRITSNSTGTTPNWFKVENKAGLVMEYGNTTDSKVMVGGTTILHWLLNKITDRYGNYIKFSYYQNSTTGEYYPLQISYTGNAVAALLPHASIQFEYESRIDSVQRYLNGMKIANSTKRLKAVKAYYGSTVYRSYTFNYQYSSANLSELTSFQECGRNGNCNTPTTFTWSSIGTLAFTTTNVTNVQLGAAQNKVFNTEVNTDGVQDIMRVVQGGNLEAYVSNKSVTGLAFTGTTINPSIQVSSKILTADFNGDARQDFMLYDSTSGANSICINTTVTGGTQIANNQTTSPIPTTVISNNKQVVAIDLNGDGRSDLLTFDVSTGNSYWLFSKSAGNAGLSFEPNGSSNYFQNLIPTTYFAGSYQPFFADLNGDGLTDILFYNPVTGVTVAYQNLGGTIVSYQQVASNFITPSQLAAAGGRLFLTDVNADGLPDIMYYVKSSGANTWWINKGNYTFQNQVSNLSASLISGGDNLLQLDFNGDGFADIVWTDKTSGNNHWFINDGRLNFTQLVGNVIAAPELAGYDLQGIGNFTSRSSFDLFLFNDAKTPRAKILKGNTGTNNLITRIVCGNGQATDINYDFLTSDSLYTKNDSALYPLMDYQATHPVVKNYQVDDGIGGKNAVSYHYAGAKIHLNGRGFRGFTEVQETDQTTGIAETRTYQADSNSWKYINSPLIKSVKRLANGTIISQTDIQNGLKTYFNGKCYFSYVISSTTKNYETNGSFVDSVRTTNTYDDYGNVISTVTDYGGGMRDSLVNVTYNFANDWILGRLASSHLYRLSPTQPTIVKASAFDYDPINGSLIREITESDSGNTIKIIKSYHRDVYGNILHDTVTAWNGTAVEKRVTGTTYDSLGRFPITVTNAIGHTATQTYDPYLGHAVTQTDANNHTSLSFQDNLGRQIKTINPDGTWTTQDYRKCGGAQVCPINATMLIYQQSSNASPVVTYYDLLNRVVRTKTTGFNGTDVYVDKTYNSRGLLAQETEPYYSGTATPNLIQYTYDELGRPIRTVRPGNRIDSIKYNGHTTITINALGRKSTIVKNAKGNVVTSIDNQNNTLSYTYDAAGRMIKTTDPNGNNIKWEYDIYGNKTKEDDPDRGITVNVFNGFGELISSTRGTHVVTYKYDSLGRIKQRTELEGTTKYYYDGQSRGIGMLDSVVSYDFKKEFYLRDTLGRVVSVTKRIDSNQYTESTTYDSIGRVKTMIDPKGFSKTNVYNAYGYFYQIKNTATGIVYYQASIVNAKGQVEQVLHGNGTQVNKTYDPVTNFLVGINTKKGATYLQAMRFAYDAIGNLTQRKDSLQGKQEDFWLDDLNRLTKSKVLGGDSVTIQYNSIGNITNKSDVGAYTYGGVNSGPHRVVSITGPNAVCVPSLLVSTQYNSYDKVREVIKDSTRMIVLYDAGHQRNVQKMWDSSRLVRIKIYAFPDFEKEIKGGDTIITHFIQGPEGAIAAYTTHSASGHPAATVYYHRDHLGSAVMVTNDTGLVVAKFSFDAWGRRRNANWSTTLTDTATLFADRGFTGHEHYDLFELVDMNGRIYDPVLGRFTSPDPVIQDIYNLQTLNRYSYCGNNPLSFTDPSGYSFLSKIFKGIGHAVSSAVHWVGENWKSLATVAVAVVVGTLTAGWGVFLSGAAAGFASSTTSTLLAGGNLGDALKAGIKSAVIGGITARLTFGVGESFTTSEGVKHLTDYSNVLEKAIAHGVIQGAASVANGGDFIHSFLAAAASTGAELGTNNITSYYGRVAAAAVVGGTTSEISGGNFANGAVSAAFVQMYNAEGARREAIRYLDKFEYGTVGFYIHEGIGLVYPLVGNFASADIGTFYRAHEYELSLPATRENVNGLMVKETAYWKSLSYTSTDVFGRFFGSIPTAEWRTNRVMDIKKADEYVIDKALEGAVNRLGK